MCVSQLLALRRINQAQKEPYAATANADSIQVLTSALEKRRVQISSLVTYNHQLLNDLAAVREQLNASSKELAQSRCISVPRTRIRTPAYDKSSAGRRRRNCRRLWRLGRTGRRLPARMLNHVLPIPLRARILSSPHLSLSLAPLSPYSAPSLNSAFSSHTPCRAAVNGQEAEGKGRQARQLSASCS